MRNDMDPYQKAIEDRIADLVGYRRWWRDNRWADWPEIRKDADVELRALLRIARKVRREQRKAVTA